MDDVIEILLDKGPVEERQRRLDRIARRDSPRTYAEVESCEIHDTDISGLDLCAVRISKSTLRSVSCSGTIFGRLTGCTLDTIAGEDATFSRTENCKLDRARLRRAQFAQRITHSTFTEADLTQFRIGPPVGPGDWYPSSGLGAEFRAAAMEHSDLAGVTLPGCSFAESRLARTRFSFAYLADCDFNGADLSHVNLLMADLRGASMRSARLDGALVTAEQRKFLAEVAGADVGGCVVPALPPATTFSAVEALLSRVRDYFISWDMRDDVTGETHHLMVSCDEKRRPLARGMVTKGRMNWRDYSLAGPKPLSIVLADIAYDYVGWRADASSLDVQHVTGSSLARLLPSLRDALAELSVNVS